MARPELCHCYSPANALSVLAQLYYGLHVNKEGGPSVYLTDSPLYPSRFHSLLSFGKVLEQCQMAFTCRADHRWSDIA